ncbi:response regulator [Nodosilinea sp. E11]|uniref:response regulator n=1 Tax=Nodosilinea sp. E11 TaxID=3037479 RepID=UPI002934B4D1|nr:response regulator [Nodosilinea sp. E11]WOD40365.1 response regulator [Nodosilinea sp. E11]
MQPSATTYPATILCIACGPVNGSLFQQWLGDKRFYRLIFWESPDSFDLDSTGQPTIILLGSQAGIESLPALAAQWPTARVVVILDPAQANTAASWLNRGADDYLMNDSFSGARLTYSVQRLLTQARAVDRQVAARTAALRQAKEAAEAANQINRRLITDLGHGLRNPLNAILGFSQMLSQDATLSDQQREGLDIIHSSGEHLLALINGMLGMAKTEAAVAPRPSDRRAVALAAGQPTYRLLIVDDNWTNRVLLQTLLAPLGFELQVATSGQEAIPMWADWQPHLIWMSLAMAEMDGYETTCRLRTIEQTQLQPETPADLFVPTKIIALTDGTEVERFRAIAAGCNDVVSKPLRPHLILEKLADHLAVQYTYAADLGQAEQLWQKNDSVAPASALPPNCLAFMPMQWQRQLHEATVKLDADNLLALLEALPADQAPLAEALRARIQEFDFETILTLVQTVLDQAN